jgi:hypothetical protein
MGVVWLFPEARAFFSKDGVTLGELGLFVIIAYAAGQLVQAIGNWLEWIWWKCWGGMPSQRVKTGKLLAGEHDALVSALGDHMDPPVENIEKIPAKDWSIIVRRVYAIIATAKRNARVDIFSGNYGMMRGLSAAILVLIIGAVLARRGIYDVTVLTILFALAVHRMHRYSRLYAVELFIQFLLRSGERNKQVGDGN